MVADGEASQRIASWRRFWTEHYREIFAGDDTWLDYSNERVHVQTLGLCVEASGSLAGLDCLDVGSGRGQLAEMLHALGGRVVAAESNHEQVSRNRARAPQVDWREIDLLDADARSSLPRSERVFAVEVLQCLPWAELMPDLLERVAPGGRLIVVVPFGECPIVKRTIARLEGFFSAPTTTELRRLAALPEIAVARFRALTFQADQRICPYAVSAWSEVPEWPLPPNRVQFVLEKRS